MALPSIWALFVAALGVTTAVIWWRSRSQEGMSSPGRPPSHRHPRPAVVPVRSEDGSRGRYAGRERRQ